VLIVLVEKIVGPMVFAELVRHLLIAGPVHSAPGQHVLMVNAIHPKPLVAVEARQFAIQ